MLLLDEPRMLIYPVSSHRQAQKGATKGRRPVSFALEEEGEKDQRFRYSIGYNGISE